MSSSPPEDQARIARLGDEAVPEIIEAMAALEGGADLGMDEGPSSFDGQVRVAASSIVETRLEVAGFELTESEVSGLVDRVLAKVKKAERYEAQRSDRSVQARTGWGPPGDYKLLGNPAARQTWQRVYRPVPSRIRIRAAAHHLPHGAHRRDPSHRPVRRPGSRRSTGTSASRGDPGDGDPDGEHHPLAVRDQAAGVRP
jgi:hypothetical protein